MSDKSHDRGAAFVRNALRFLTMVIGVAFCVEGKAPLLLPASFLVVLLAVEREASAAQYFAVLTTGILVAIITGSSMALWRIKLCRLDSTLPIEQPGVDLTHMVKQLIAVENAITFGKRTNEYKKG